MENIPLKKVVVIGAGLAGCDCAWSLAQLGVHVVLCESKRLLKNPAQKQESFAELVCTNSLKSLDEHSAHGLLKTEMERLGSLVLAAAKVNATPAGDALAVDREKFSAYITQMLESHPLIECVDIDVSDPVQVQKNYGAQAVIVATGPLTNPPLEQWIMRRMGKEDLYFYDAIAPVVDAHSLDYSKLYFKDRHKDPAESADYLNVPLNKEQYLLFMEELSSAQKVLPKNFEKEYFFESCLPIDVMAQRGIHTARFSCMKPMGLEHDMPGGFTRPYAVVQLRKENLQGSAFNMVGFQTRLTYPEQKRIFRTLPGFEQAEFLHYGSVHLHAKKMLDPTLMSKSIPGVFFAGQIVGVEGYTESAACGLYTALQVHRYIQDKPALEFPLDTCLGALLHHVLTSDKPSPTNMNFGLLPAVELSAEEKKCDRKKLRKEKVVSRAKQSFEKFAQDHLA
jgi:methylenetetrahydrofolate--tRNA-(uracil-5-)-methyltransferase